MRAVFAGLLASVAAFNASAAPLVNLVPNRAQYVVSLASTRPGGMVAVQGRTVVEFRDTCTGWTMTQRFIADMTNAKGEAAHTDFIVSSGETKDGTGIRFKIRDMVDGKVTQRLEGAGTLASAGGQVRLTAPRGQSFVLPPGTILPTQHTLAVLRAASSGEHTFHQTVFQGGDTNDLFDAATVIGNPVGRGDLARDRGADASGLLGNVPAWPVLISYFPHGSGDEQAAYEIAYRLYANGVVSSMSLIYPNFTMKAELVRLERLPSNC